jgi:CBS-domain-containing membrane protein
MTPASSFNCWSGHVVAILSVQLLSNNKVLSAAILDEEGEYLGAVSVPDILRGLVRNLEVSATGHSCCGIQC